MLDRETMTRAYDPAADERTAAIRRLNDDLRCRGSHRGLAVTAGVIALGKGALPAILVALRAFSAFTRGNDPHGEHDFGSLDWCGTKLFWKIDYYDLDLQFGSPDPADPSVTTRVLTVMPASEY